MQRTSPAPAPTGIAAAGGCTANPEMTCSSAPARSIHLMMRFADGLPITPGHRRARHPAERATCCHSPNQAAPELPRNRAALRLHLGKPTLDRPAHRPPLQRRHRRRQRSRSRRRRPRPHTGPPRDSRQTGSATQSSARPKRHHEGTASEGVGVSGDVRGVAGVGPDCYRDLPRSCRSRRRAGGVLLERPQPRSGEDERAGRRRAAADHWEARNDPFVLVVKGRVCPGRGWRSGLASTHPARAVYAVGAP